MGTVRVTRFGGVFLPTWEEHKDLENLIEQSEDLYPGIYLWFRRRVLSGLQNKERTAYLVYEDDRPVGATVLRLGKDSKICSLRITPEAEKMGFGRLLMALVAKDMRNQSTYSHFTIPEHIWSAKSSFFEEYGFKCHGKAGEQYRLWDQEFACRASFNDVWTRVIRTLPSILKSVTVNGVKSDYDLVMSIHPRFSHKVVSGEKKVEIRRQFSRNWVGSHTLVYSSQPDGSFIGSFRIADVVEGSPSEIWQTFGFEVGCTVEEFSDYTKGKERVYAIVTSDPVKFKAPVLRTQLSQLVKADIKAPQSHCKIDDKSVLQEAASISTILQSTL